MAKMFPPEDPGVTFGRIGHQAFVNALGTLALARDISVENAAIKVGANVDDLLVFLDARANEGLTEAGRTLVQTFDGRALQAATANIAMRQQAMVSRRWKHQAQRSYPWFLLSNHCFAALASKALRCRSVRLSRSTPNARSRWTTSNGAACSTGAATTWPVS
ncbi:hypothetical protein J2W49_003962 [Hydrogenophaga palleronii]|uniref:Uncharacterized protein n=1 Tax=Hydrogenophaga palleronii TaxID=65655 RepID=A0ABU1WRS0_9BURK|nr:hypothetical protein [Hydrogenophaga palleronii]MDR7151986.1 hypothetical protein [Hydrogenophaga palleronii]